MPSVAALNRKLIKSLPKAEPMLAAPRLLIGIAKTHEPGSVDKQRKALLYQDSLRRVHNNPRPDGWYESQRRDFNLDLLADYDLVAVSTASDDRNRRVYLYKLLPAGAELIGIQTIKENAVNSKYKQGDEVLFEEHKVTILEVGEKNRLNIRLNTQDRPIWVDEDQVTPLLPPKTQVPPELLKLAGDDDKAARALYGLLNTIHAHGGWFVVPMATSDRSEKTAERREQCEKLRGAKLLERQYGGTRGYEYRLTQEGASLLGIPYPYSDPTLTTEQQHPALYALAKRLNPDVGNVAGIVEEYIGTLRICHGDTKERAWTPIGTRHRRIHFAQHLAEGGFVLLRNHKQDIMAEWQITKAGSEAIGWEHPEIAPEVIETPAEPAPAAAPSAVDQAEAVINGITERPAVEVKTLRQEVGQPEKLIKADCDLAEHLSDHWSTMDIQYIKSGELGILTRFVMLKRINQADPAPRAPRYAEAVGPLLSYQPGPIAQALREEGFEAVMDKANDAVMNAFRESLAESTAIIQPQTLIPAFTLEVK